MSDGSSFEVILKIGFLNTLKNNPKYENRLKAHEKGYDIILPGYKGFEEINSILKQLI